MDHTIWLMDMDGYGYHVFLHDMDVYEFTYFLHMDMDRSGFCKHYPCQSLMSSIEVFLSGTGTSGLEHDTEVLAQVNSPGIPMQGRRNYARNGCGGGNIPTCN